MDYEIGKRLDNIEEMLIEIMTHLQQQDSKENQEEEPETGEQEEDEDPEEPESEAMYDIDQDDKNGRPLIRQPKKRKIKEKKQDI